jgi:type IV fimbrial biogenesis protein FimT
MPTLFSACRAHARACAGFTFIELMIVVAIVAILTTLSSADLSSLVQSSRQGAVRDQLQTLLSLARAESIRRGEHTVVCNANAQQCLDNGRSGKTRFETLLLFVDLDQDRLVSQGDELIREQRVESPTYLVWNRGDSIVYQADGSLLGGSNGSFYIFHADDLEQGVKLVAQMSGRVRYAKLNASDRRGVAAFLSSYSSSSTLE